MVLQLVLCPLLLNDCLVTEGSESVDFPSIEVCFLGL